MRLLLLSSVALLGCCVSALAADLPSRRPPPAMAPIVPAFTWTGGYFGVNAGYSFDNDRDFGLGLGTLPGVVAANHGQRSDGFTGGGQIGYNYEIDGPGFDGLPIVGGRGAAGIVAGVEADAAYLDSRASNDNIGIFGVDTRYSGDTNFLGTLRGRVGVAFGTLLVYGTGGFAYGGVNTSVAISGATGTNFYYGQHDRVDIGAAYGGGIEYALPTASFLNVFNSNAVTLKAEFLHYELADDFYRSQGTLAGRNTDLHYPVRVFTQGNIVRAGLNYKFGSVPLPVVARY